MLIALVAAVGAILGALTPWPAHRLSVEYGTPPRTACPRCERAYGSSWFRLSANCPSCGERVAPRLWVYALAGAIAFGLLAWALGPVPELAGYLIIAAFGLPLAAIDLACLRLPDPFVLGALLLGGGWLTLLAATDGDWSTLGRAALAALVSVVAYVVLGFLPGANLGFGDVKLAGVLGFALGWLSWPAALLGLVVPHLVNGPVAVVLLATGRADRRSDLPLGPALLVGAVLAVVLDVRVLG